MVDESPAFPVVPGAAGACASTAAGDASVPAQVRPRRGRADVAADPGVAPQRLNDQGGQSDQDRLAEEE